MRTPPLIRLEKASFGYGGRPVVRGASLDVAPGDFAGVVGPNGSGKSTLLRGLLGLLKPLAGRVERGAALGNRVGWVPQRDAVDPVFPATALDVARMGRSLVAPWHARLTGADEKLARKALDTVGLAARGSTPFHVLSGGQRQRALIARALAVDPLLLVLDEPTAGVDPQAEAGIVALLRELNRDRGLAIVMVTHQLERLRGAATRLFEVHEGRVQEGSS